MSTRLYIAPDFQASLPSRGASVIAFDEAWERWRGETVDQNNMRDVEFVDFGGVAGYLKRFHGIQTKNHWRLHLQKPKAQSQAGRENAMIHALQGEGFTAPRVLAWGQEIRRGRELRSLLLTEPYDGTALSELHPESRLRLLPRVAEVLGATVAAGLFLPDLGLDHSFALDDDKIGLLDFHNARRSPQPSRRELGRALVRFFRSPGAEDCQEAREDFARRYLAAAGRLDAWKKTKKLFATRLSESAQSSA